MKITYNWLKEYVDISLSPDELTDVLTNLGLEVEEVEEWISVPGGLKDVVVGRVLSSEKHPDADKLSVNIVDAGGPEPLTIVCGAPNVAAGQLVPVALPGSIALKGGEKVQIKRSKIRGQISEGMICAEDEIGLGTSHAGIMVLDPRAIPGTPAAEYFGVEKDTVYTIGLTPNRIDSGSHFGAARDIAAFLNLHKNTKATYPSLEKFSIDNEELYIDIEIENKRDCMRYTGLTLTGVSVEDSPLWLKNRLKAIGMNPVNNIVDITNFVLHETGQPLHAFDADKIKGNKVIVRNMSAGKQFITLDGVERTLSPEDLMICNATDPMCIAGVFGGIESGITSATTKIFLESAWFNPVSVRRTSKRHGLHTDASFRFERGADIDITVTALKRAALMIREITGAKISSPVIDVYPEKKYEKKIRIKYTNIDRLTGKVIDVATIKKILLSLNFTILSEDTKGLELSVPNHKVDVSREADIIEEILRIYGYNNIETGTQITSALSYSRKPDIEKIVNTIADMLAANGFIEIMSNSLTPSAWFESEESFDKARLVTLANPLSGDLNVMRQSLLPGGLNAIAWNIHRQNANLRLFEFGKSYFVDLHKKASGKVDLYSEKNNLDLFVTGLTTLKTWNSTEKISDFFLIRSFVEMILKRMGFDPEHCDEGNSGHTYFSESITYSAGGKLLASAGKISKQFSDRFDIRQDVFYGHIEWDTVLRLVKNNRITHKQLPKYPSVRRDLALLVDKSIRYEELRKIAFATEKNILRAVELFDVYEHESLDKDKKSYALSFLLRDDLRTLNEQAIDRVMNNLIRAFEVSAGAIIRK